MGCVEVINWLTVGKEEDFLYPNPPAAPSPSRRKINGEIPHFSRAPRHDTIGRRLIMRGPMPLPLAKWRPKRRLDENRRHKRRTAPWLRIEAEGHAYIAENWSAGGAALPHFHGNHAVGTLVSGAVSWSALDQPTPFIATIIRSDIEGAVALQWLELEPDMLGELDATARAQ